MKIFENIVPAIRLYATLNFLAKYKNGILDARKAGDFEKEREYILKATDTWGNRLVKAYDIHINVSGIENLPAKGPVVFVSNHQGYADIPICCAVLNKFQFGFVAKNDLEKIPLYGGWIKRIRSVMIERDDARASLRAIDEGIGLINNGFSLLIFPEGTRSKSRFMSEFKRGSLRLATKPGVPVIPITISGTYRVIEETNVVKRGKHVDFVIHPAIKTQGMDKAEANALTGEVEKIISDTLNRLV